MTPTYSTHRILDKLEKTGWILFALLLCGLAADLFAGGWRWRFAALFLPACGCLAVFCAVLRHARVQMRELEDLHGHLIPLMLHDIKNPLASILMAVTSAETYEAAPAMRELLLLARKSSQMQQRVLESLQKVVSLESGTVAPACQPFRLGEFLDSCVHETRAITYGRETRIEMQTAAGLPEMIRADMDLLRGAIVNLLLDSLKYTPRTGVITISASLQKGSFVFEVADTGPGVEQEFIPSLFSKHLTKEQRSRRVRKSIGLNLYYCRLVAEAHGGWVMAENRPGGFAVRLGIPAVC
jgi:signal transduction histidine kinase